MKITFPFYMMRASEMAQAALTPIRDAIHRINRVPTAPRLVLANKSQYEPHATVSIQASKHHYCSPREDLHWHLYDSFELGFPSDQPAILDPYGEYESDMVTCSGVYNRVPKEIVQQYINEQGGIIGYSNGPATEAITFELTDEEISFYILNNS